MENIIKKAIEGGYASDRPDYARQHLITGFEGDFRFMILDPLFWQSLGKACRNLEGHTTLCPHLVCSMDKGIENSLPKWKYCAIRFHEINLTESFEKAVEYLENLIKE